MHSQDMASRLSGEPPARNYVRPRDTRVNDQRARRRPFRPSQTPRRPQGGTRPPARLPPAPLPRTPAAPFLPPAAGWWGAAAAAGLLGGFALGSVGLRMLVTALTSLVSGPGWSQCPTPNCSGTVTHWFWTNNTECAPFAACPTDQTAIHIERPPGYQDPTRYNLFFAEKTSEIFGGLYTYRKQFVRTDLNDTQWPSEWLLWDGLDLLRKWERGINQEYPHVDPGTRPPFAPMPEAGGKPIPYWAAPYRVHIRIDRVSDVQPAPQPNGPSAPPRPPALPPSAVPAVEFVAQGDVRTRNEDAWHMRRPPQRNEKERKTNVSAMMGRFIRAGLDAATEFVDVVDAVYEALPEKLRRKEWSKSMRENHRGLTPQEKIQSIFENGNSLDLNDVVDNIAEALIEDAVLGQVGRELGRANRNIGHRGLGIGPAL